eukprot:scaffold22569_cov116-Cylindrotheca_fusiformis.AAC.8
MTVRISSSVKGNASSSVIPKVFLLVICGSLITIFVHKELVRHIVLESQWSDVSDVPDSLQIEQQQQQSLGTMMMVSNNSTEVNNNNNSIIIDVVDPTTTTITTSDPKEPYDREQYAPKNADDDNNVKVIVPHFQRQEGVVIVTKIHGPHQYKLLVQSFCLLTKAYNERMKYDIVVFYTENDISQPQIQRLQRLVFPANVTIVLDTLEGGLQAEINALSTDRRAGLLKRCNVTSSNDIDWYSNCPGRLAYNWQAEFRTVRIWTHPALAKYKYMMWVDADTFATRVWEQDPIAYAVAHDLVLFAGHMRGGSARPEENERIYQGFQTRICSIGTSNGGYFTVKTDPNCIKRHYYNVGGFFHITNLNFYRSPPVLQWMNLARQDCFLCRSFDDQFAVTVPAAILAPNRSKGMTESGIRLDLFHNGRIDGTKKAIPGGFRRYFRIANFSEAVGICPITEAN